ncbi:dTDP-4-dehydrorhamnose reductase [Ginsengibacter hankyongi]|uniref:dTDP-4-dehydrorhamnose reductase n=1 Tax=Ginsengibacter hankyongi TaxID=2607284 RepID=A0A5J5IIQ9_9BACT|nr:dTDP-4-dehydrorhamnose reductase [Ginsengibacter hankyongi]KAA9039222.1 dTDP-4-dehydrorhamnose reductase [Ginsengibacter hankyongi]
MVDTITSTDYKSTILVTGANGQLGSELRQLSLKYPAYKFLFTSKEELAIEDANSLREFFEKQQVNYCVNCAAYTAVDKAETETEKAFLINADAAGFLASTCNDHHTKLIHISTDYVYDGTSKQALKEEDAVAPLNVYGWSKLKGEELVLNHNSSALIIRTSWVYSVYGNNFVKTMLRLFKEKESINVVNDQYGCPTYAADLAQIIMTFVEGTENNNEYNGIVNYCNAGITTWFEFALTIKEFVNSSCKIFPVPTSQYSTPAKRPQYSVLDTSKIKRILNINIPSWQESLHKCLRSYSEINN